MSNLHTWLTDRTFHFSEFSDLARLVELKQAKNLTISLCFPTLNEEKTIAKSLVIMKSELMERHPLLDEIAVIDSGSTDNTCAIVKAFGIPAYQSADYLPGEGLLKGKGDNLWKALYLLKGDIIVFIDSDISNIHHRFAYGLLGPLLTRNDIRFVKAFYKRPFRGKAGLAPSGGGRVTEILIRPLFSQFFPELSGFIQPLSGEYAGYRDILERISFPIGYGVETGMLIDIAQQYGIDIMAQTDLDQRIHRNQETVSLGKMAFGILQTFWKRLTKYKHIGPFDEAALTLKQITSELGKPHRIGDIRIEEKERQPIIEVEAYRKEHKRDL